MSTEIPVRRIAFDKYILAFTVLCPNSVRVLLMTDKDATLVNTEYITRSSKDFLREASEDGCDMEAFDSFANRMYGEAQSWASEAIRTNKQARELAKAVASVLPPSIDTD